MHVGGCVLKNDNVYEKILSSIPPSQIRDII